jgi:regulatory protein
MRERGHRAARAQRPKRTLKQRAVGLLARRDYSRADLATRLAAEGAERGEVDALLDELQRLGWLCDERFANAVVRQKAGSYAPRAIERTLRDHGVARDVAAQALAQAGGADELAQAKALWQRRFGTAPRDEREKARQLRFLVSRGFATSIAYRVLRAAGVRVDED